MFGKNPIRSATYNSRSLAIEAIFYTIQGEGPYSGRPALFIRLAGCNLACTFCDTQFETMANTPQVLDEIIDNIKACFTKKQRRLVVLTGGEPMRQDWSDLAYWLFSTGTETIQVETAGTLWQPSLNHHPINELRTGPREGNIVYVCSPKTPKINPRIAEVCRHWKYVVKVGSVDLEGDGLPNRGTQLATVDTEQRLYRPSIFEGYHHTIWVSPCDEYDTVRNKANQNLARDLCLMHGYRLSLQTHKIIGVE